MDAKRRPEHIQNDLSESLQAFQSGHRKLKLKIFRN
jgi:hypothetical protein